MQNIARFERAQVNLWSLILNEALVDLPLRLDSKEFTHPDGSDEFVQTTCVNFKIAYGVVSDTFYLTVHMLDGRSFFLSVRNLLHPHEIGQVNLKIYDGGNVQELSGSYLYGHASGSVEDVASRLRNYAMQMLRWHNHRLDGGGQVRPFKCQVINLDRHRTEKGLVSA